MEFQEIGVFRSDIFDHNSIWLIALRRGWLQLGVCKTNSEYTEHNDSEKPDHLRPEIVHRDLLAARFFHSNDLSLGLAPHVCFGPIAEITIGQLNVDIAN